MDTDISSIQTRSVNEYVFLEKYDKLTDYCGLFSILTCQEFMENKSMSEVIHDKNLNDATETIVHYIGKVCLKDLHDIINLTTLDDFALKKVDKDIISSGKFKYESIIPTTSIHMCTIIERDGEYVAVLYDGEKYAIRDCKEDTQYNFATRNIMLEYLTGMYHVKPDMDINHVTIWTKFVINVKKIDYGQPDIYLTDKKGEKVEHDFLLGGDTTDKDGDNGQAYNSDDKQLELEMREMDSGRYNPLAKHFSSPEYSSTFIEDADVRGEYFGDIDLEDEYRKQMGYTPIQRAEKVTLNLNRNLLNMPPPYDDDVDKYDEMYYGA